MAQKVIRLPFTAEARVRAGTVHMIFLVDKMALGQVSPRVHRFILINIIPPGLHARISLG
jgi:hypothetical protein